MLSAMQEVDVYVNKAGLSGKLKVKVILEDKIYDTGVVVAMD